MAPGHAYIYFIYGMYHCLNFVTEPEEEPSAVLLRGLESAAGAETMKRLRFGDAPHERPIGGKTFSTVPARSVRRWSSPRPRISWIWRETFCFSAIPWRMWG